jgi:protein arginine kinase activator
MMPGNACSLCGKNEASCFFQYCSEDGEKHVLAICDECAESRGADLSSVDGVASMFEVAAEDGVDGPVRVIDMGEINPECPACGKSFQEIIDSGHVGCETCYSEYGSILRQVRQILDEDAPGPLPMEACDLNAELEKAISEENYEEAARLRDLIEDMESRDV